MALFVAAVPTCMKETRSGVLLMRLARKLRAQTGNPHYRARIEDERGSLRNLIYISCTRPVCTCATACSLPLSFRNRI